MHELIKYSGKVFGFLDFVYNYMEYFPLYILCVFQFVQTHFTFELKLPHNMFNESISNVWKKFCIVMFIYVCVCVCLLSRGKLEFIVCMTNITIIIRSVKHFVQCNVLSIVFC